MQKFIFFFAVGAWAVTQGTAEEDYVEIWPPNPMVELGGSLDLNCTSTCEHIGIESAYTTIPIGNGSNWKAFRLSNVNFWAGGPSCYAECKTGQKKSPKANIIVYKSPASIKVFPVPDMEVGKPYKLTCWVLWVAPIRNLTVTLLKGEEQLEIKTFEDYTHPELYAVEVNHTITAQEDDYNKTITCQTSLDLRPRGPLLKNTSQGISLWTFGTAEEDYVEIWPPNPMVEFGGSLDLNCTSTCGHIGIASAYTTIPIGNGSNWKAFRLSNVNYWAASPLCYAECKTGQKKSPKANIIVYKSPTSIELLPVPDMEVGKPYKLTCHVLWVAPFRNLTVTLLKGDEQLLIETFEDHPWPEADAFSVSHNITAQKDDYNKTITCQTSLDLRPRGPLLKNTSQGKSLWTFDFAKTPLLHAGLFLEAGTPMKVTCDAPEVSPAKEATFGLWFAGEYLTSNTTVMGDLASAQAVIASSSVGEHQLLCMVSLGPVTKNVTKMVNVFAPQSIGHIIGYTVAVVVFIALVAGIAYWIRSKQKLVEYRLQKKQRQPPQTAQNSAEQRFLNGEANV